MGYQLRRRKIPGRLILLAPVVVLEGVAVASKSGFSPTAQRSEEEELETVEERVRMEVNLAQSLQKSAWAPSLSSSAEPVVPEPQPTLWGH